MSLQKVGRRRKADYLPDLPEPKERILKAALQLFQEKGYAGVAIRDITSAADVTQATLYHHFGDKKGLYIAVVVQTLEEILKSLRKAIFTPGFENQLVEMLTVFYRYRRASIGTMLHEMTIHDEFTVEDAQIVGTVINEGWRASVEWLMNEAIRRGELRPGNVAFYTQVIFELGFSFARSPLGNWTGWSEERQIAEVVKLLLNGFGLEEKPALI